MSDYDDLSAGLDPARLATLAAPPSPGLSSVESKTSAPPGRRPRSESAAPTDEVRHPVADVLHLACLIAVSTFEPARGTLHGYRTPGFTADYRVRRRAYGPEVGRWYFIAEVTVDTQFVAGSFEDAVS